MAKSLIQQLQALSAEDKKALIQALGGSVAPEAEPVTVEKDFFVTKKGEKVECIFVVQGKRRDVLCSTTGMKAQAIRQHAQQIVKLLG